MLALSASERRFRPRKEICVRAPRGITFRTILMNRRARGQSLAGSLPIFGRTARLRIGLLQEEPLAGASGCYYGELCIAVPRGRRDEPSRH